MNRPDLTAAKATAWAQTQHADAVDVEESIDAAADPVGAAYIRAAARHLFPSHATPRLRLEALADELDPQETR